MAIFAHFSPLVVAVGVCCSFCGCQQEEKLPVARIVVTNPPDLPSSTRCFSLANCGMRPNKTKPKRLQPGTLVAYVWALKPNRGWTLLAFFRLGIVLFLQPLLSNFSSSFSVAWSLLPVLLIQLPGHCCQLSAIQLPGSMRELVPSSAPPPPPTERALLAPAKSVAQAEDQLLCGDVNVQNFRALVIGDDDVLWEDDVLQIGLRSNYSGGLGEGFIALYFGNKSNSLLQSFSCIIHSCDPNLHIKADPMESEISPKLQKVQRLQLSLRGSGIVEKCPQISIRYLLPDNSAQALRLVLPVTITKFMQTFYLDPPSNFFKVWRSSECLGSEQSRIIPLEASLDSPLAIKSQVPSSLMLHPNLDASLDATVLVFVGKFPSCSPGGFKCSHLPEAIALVKIDIGSYRYQGQAQVVVRSDVYPFAVALHRTLIALLTAHHS